MADDIDARFAALWKVRPCAWSQFRGQRRLTVRAGDLRDALGVLRDSLGFDMLIDITAVDWLEYAGAIERFEVIYCLLNTTAGERLIVSVMLDEARLQLPSVVSLWTAADWLEREVFDMFGIRFEGHPGLTRLLLPDAYSAFPLRKDYPVQGRGERHNFPVITRAQS